MSGKGLFFGGVLALLMWLGLYLLATTVVSAFG